MHVLSLSGTDSNNGGYLQVPASFQSMGAGTAMTVSMRVYLRTNRVWQRLFDFGNSSSTGYAFLTTQTAAVAAPRFAISKTSNGGAEQAINMTTPALLSTGAWHHIAVVLGAGATYTGTLYIDHVSVGSNPAMTLRPSDLGNTANNFIGKSQFADPYLDARHRRLPGLQTRAHGGGDQRSAVSGAASSVALGPGPRSWAAAPLLNRGADEHEGGGERQGDPDQRQWRETNLHRERPLQPLPHRGRARLGEAGHHAGHEGRGRFDLTQGPELAGQAVETGAGVGGCCRSLGYAATLDDLAQHGATADDADLERGDRKLEDRTNFLVG